MIMDNDRFNKGNMPTMSSVTPIASPYKVGPTERPMMQQVTVAAPVKSDNSKLILIVIAIVAGLAAIAFAGLFVYMMSERNAAVSDVDGQIAVAVANAKEEQKQADDAEYAEIEKSPYKVFSGPKDYGDLSLEYPKTWSVYIGEDNSGAGGDFAAYFNPEQVRPVGPNTVNALRVSIRNSNFATVAQAYQKVINDGKTDLTMESITIGRNANITANLYTGTIPGSSLRGYVVVFKLRDKTAILQTDSPEQYRADVERILGTVTFNE